MFSLAGKHMRSIYGDWYPPAAMTIHHDRLYLIENAKPGHGEEGTHFTGWPHDHHAVSARRMLTLSLDGKLVQEFSLREPELAARGWDALCVGHDDMLYAIASYASIVLCFHPVAS